MCESFAEGAKEAGHEVEILNVYDGPIGTYKGITAFTGIQDMGIITACGEENKSEAKLAEVKALAASL